MKKSKIILVSVFLLAFGVGLCSCGQNEVINLTTGPKISENFEKKLDEYTNLLVKSAVNVQKGQKVLIKATVDNYYLAEKCMDKAYEAGASDVKLVWDDEYENHERAKNSDAKALNDDMVYDYLTRVGYSNEQIAYMYFDSVDPDANSDLTKEQGNKFSEAKSNASREFIHRQITNKIQWTGTAIPQKEWAKMVFPGKSEDEAVTALWSAIFEAARITGDGNAAQRWKDHVKFLQDNAEKMNNLRFKTLHYTNDLGTDLTIDLPKEHVWRAGNAKAANGIEFSPNVPTEEIYTAPTKNSANGKVYASKPLAINGKLVENFNFVLKDGKIVEIHAEKGEDVLKEEIASNEGAEYFGEVALVPFDSAICKQNIIYYHPLYDENASCHIAFGEAYPDCIINGDNLSDDEVKAAGLNFSSTHRDFMVGTSDLKIVGTTWDGKEIVIFENGNWAI